MNGRDLIDTASALIAVGDGIPSLGCIAANAHALARYAALCQERGCAPWQIHCRDGKDMSLTNAYA